ncbi:hypothetical protein ABPG72_019487 [Tetrahymena utriculariae]
MSFLKMFSFLQNQDDSNIELETIKPNQYGFYLFSELKQIEKACNRKLDFVKTTLDDMKPQFEEKKSLKNQEEKMQAFIFILFFLHLKIYFQIISNRRFKIHECSNELELAKAQINKISQFKFQEDKENNSINNILKILLEKFVIVRQQLLETINYFQENQSNQITEQKKTIQRLSQVFETEQDQQQKQKYEQIIYEEQYILNQRQQQIQEILYQLKNVVEMVQYIDQKVEEQGLMIDQVLTQTEETKVNTEQAKQEMVKFQRINKNECSNVAFCFLIGTIVVVVMLAATA